MRDYKIEKGTVCDVFCRNVYDVVGEIPVGKVITYGEIARLLGKPQVSRMVGYALKHVPETLVLPCHRVVNSQGRLVPGWEKQRQLLVEEGICFKSNGSVDMKRCLWKYDEE